METLTTESVKEIGSFVNSYGTNHKFEIKFTNGTIAQYWCLKHENAAKYFPVGQENSYELSQMDQRNGSKLTKVKPVPAAQKPTQAPAQGQQARPSSGGGNWKGETVPSTLFNNALLCSVNLVNEGKLSVDQIPASTERFIDIIVKQYLKYNEK